MNERRRKRWAVFLFSLNLLPKCTASRRRNYSFFGGASFSDFVYTTSNVMNTTVSTTVIGRSSHVGMRYTKNKMPMYALAKIVFPGHDAHQFSTRVHNPIVHIFFSVYDYSIRTKNVAASPSTIVCEDRRYIQNKHDVNTAYILYKPS